MNPSTAWDEDGQTLVVTPAGYLDLNEVPGLRHVLSEACGQGLAVVVDLGQVVGMDAVALAVLVNADRQLARVGCRLTVASPSARLLRTLRITGLDRVLTVREDHRDARPHQAEAGPDRSWPEVGALPATWQPRRQACRRDLELGLGQPSLGDDRDRSPLPCGPRSWRSSTSPSVSGRRSVSGQLTRLGTGNSLRRWPRRTFRP